MDINSLPELEPISGPISVHSEQLPLDQAQGWEPHPRAGRGRSFPVGLFPRAGAPEVHIQSEFDSAEEM